MRAVVPCHSHTCAPGPTSMKPTAVSIGSATFPGARECPSRMAAPANANSLSDLAEAPDQAMLDEVGGLAAARGMLETAAI